MKQAAQDPSFAATQQGPDERKENHHKAQCIPIQLALRQTTNPVLTIPGRYVGPIKTTTKAIVLILLLTPNCVNFSSSLRVEDVEEAPETSS
jgi:hypothetical protein